MAVQTWTFEQLGGEKKKLTLDGYAAPFGRPRQKAIFEEEFKERIQTTRYPGNSGPPTRHLFGQQWNDQMILTGRWMDRHLRGQQTATSLVVAWQDFLKDEQRVRISWGSVASFIGYCESLNVGWESDTECTWKITFLVDEKPSQTRRRLPVDSGIENNLSSLIAFVNKSRASAAAIANNLNPDFIDQLDGVFSQVAVGTSQLVRFSNQISDLESRSFGTLQRLRLGIQEVKTAVLNLQSTIGSATDDGVLFTRQAPETVITLAQFRADNDVNAMIILDLLASMHVSVERVLTGKAYTSYEARVGDSWESISTQIYHGADGAGKIRAANGIKYGELPVPGVTYRIPQ